MRPLTVFLPILSLLPLLTLSPRPMNHHEGIQSFLYYSEPRGDANTLCPGSLNTLAPWTGTPVKVGEVENGALYIAGDGDDQLYVVLVYGSAYDMGYAHGTLLKDAIQAVIPAFYHHLEEEVEQYIKFLPLDIRDLIAELGLDGALDLTHLLTRDYSPPYFFEELHGLADASGVDYDLLVRLHMLPELVKAGCSMLGAWGQATVSASAAIQLRSLDWDVDGPLQNAPTVVIYHPDNGHTFANVGWSGWIASVSGMSSRGIAISEKHSDEPFGKESRIGIPFNFLMRDVLQFDTSLQDSIRRIQEAHRTCSIWLGVGDANEKTFRLFEYSKSTDKVFDDKNVTMIDESRFNREHCDDTCYHNYSMTDLVYWGVHLGCWNQVLHDAYGKIDAATVMQLVGKVQTGNLQAVVYDLDAFEMYVSNARGDKEQGKSSAYDRQFVKLNMNDLFTLPKPHNT